MFSIKINISYFIMLINVVRIQGLVKLPTVEDNNIALAETAIRNTVNNLFTAFKIKDMKHIPRLKQYSTIHNYFVSITLTDCDNLKEIARLTRVNNIDNKTERFITEVNEVLNEDDKSHEANDNSNHLTKYIDMFIRKLKYLKEIHVSNTYTDINADIMKYLNNDNNPLTNVADSKNISRSNGSDENVLNDNEFWQQSGRRIYKGRITNIKTFPFMASVQFFKNFQCAGSIIKDDLVITSSSCLQLAWNNRFFRENPAFLSVQIGSDWYLRNGDNIAVIEIHFHPGYEPKQLRNNLAIMRLTRKIAFKRKHKRVKKIDFDRNPWPMPNNAGTITIIGWGAKDENNIISNDLKNKLSYAELDYYPQGECKALYSEDFVREENFCAGFLSKGSGACNRDAGGPGIMKGILVGVISFGSPICGAPDSPTVFTKLGFYTDWIESIMEESAPNVGHITSTSSPKSRYPHHFKVTTNFTKNKLTPIMADFTVTSTPGIKMSPLRIGQSQDQGFKDFLATMFGSDELREYFDKSSTQSKKVTKEDASSDTEQKQKEEASKHKKDRQIKLKKVEPVTTTTDKPDYSSEEIVRERKVTAMDNFETATKSLRQVTAIENTSTDDKTLDKDIMTLIDNLDVDSILKPMKTSLKNAVSIEQNTNSKEEELVQESTSSSGETDNISPKQQSVFNFLFLSDEDGGGMSIQAESFKDLTFRDRPNNTKSHNILSETALYDLISLAIDEEKRRLEHKKKHYVL